MVLSFSSQLSAANQQAERHISSRLQSARRTSLALCPPSIASTVWRPLLHKLPVSLLSSPFQRRCCGSIETWPSQARMVLISTPARRSVAVVCVYSACGIVDTRSRSICWRTASTSHASGVTGTRDVKTTMIYTHVLNHGGRSVRSPADVL